MKRTLASALLPFALWAGCESNEPPNTAGNCKGLITVQLDVPGGVNRAGAISSTVIGPEGVRYEQLDTPPLAQPNVLLRVRDLYRPGNHYVRVVAAAGDPSKGGASSSVAVAAVARASSHFQQACPSLNLKLQAPQVLDICYDRCDAELRCGQITYPALEGCHAECRQNEAALAQQQRDWGEQYENADEIVARLEGCNFVSCGAIESCGENVWRSAVRKP